ncbi:hypothetical protein [Nocardia brevicatena]|uniref:hypothetical protein n=1 Tax=Nocardia brevicatena TaxID=37327 RepID=UPI0002FE7FF1|nr:hypothetical protein [Nocardia brevicatena]
MASHQPAEFALPALRFDRVSRDTTTTAGARLSRPTGMAHRVDAEEPGRPVDDADRLLDGFPFGPGRAAYPRAPTRAMRTVASRPAGTDLPLRDYARQCLGCRSTDYPNRCSKPPTPGSAEPRRYSPW